MEINKRNFKKILTNIKLSEFPSLDDYLRNVKAKLVSKTPLSVAENLMAFPKLKKYFEDIDKEQNRHYVNTISLEKFSHRPPLPFQVDGIKFLLLNNKCILADDTGVGKSIQAVLAALLLPEDNKILVITMKTLKYNFEEEIKFYNNSYKVIEKEWESGFKFTIVHYDSLKKWKKDILKEKFNCVIVDECFTYDTKVITDRGDLCIGDIVENKKNVKILSYNHQKKKAEFKNIKNFWKNSPKDTLLKIKIRNGQQYLNYEVTHNHKLYIINENRYLKAFEVKKGDKLYMLQKRNAKELLFELFKRMFKYFQKRK